MKVLEVEMIWKPMQRSKVSAFGSPWGSQQPSLSPSFEMRGRSLWPAYQWPAYQPCRTRLLSGTVVVSGASVGQVIFTDVWVYFYVSLFCHLSAICTMRFSSFETQKQHTPGSERHTLTHIHTTHRAQLYANHSSVSAWELHWEHCGVAPCKRNNVSLVILTFLFL